MSEKSPVVILIRESAAQSWTRDSSTFTMFVGLIGIGWLLGSSAMEWVGAFVGFVVLIGQCCGRKKEITFTIPEARAELDRLEALKS